MCDFYWVGITCLLYALDCIRLFAGCNFWKSPFYCHYNAEFVFGTNKSLIFWTIFFTYLVGYCCRIMSDGSPQRRVWQGTKEDMAVFRAKNYEQARHCKAECCWVCIMVAPLDNIREIIQTDGCGYLHNYTCVILTRLVREFCAHLKVVQGDDWGMVL